MELSSPLTHKYFYIHLNKFLTIIFTSTCQSGLGSVRRRFQFFFLSSKKKVLPSVEAYIINFYLLSSNYKKIIVLISDLVTLSPLHLVHFSILLLPAHHYYIQFICIYVCKIAASRVRIRSCDLFFIFFKSKINRLKKIIISFSFSLYHSVNRDS